LVIWISAGYSCPLLVLMGITYVLFLLVHGVLTRLHFYRLVWHRALFNVALRLAAWRRGLTQSIPDDMKKPLLTIGRVVLTLLIVSFAVVVVWRMVLYYMFAPWTRDGHIRADIVQIAPDVSGLIQQVDVRDNQLIKRGQVLFSIDQDRFKLALRQAKAAVADRKKPWPRPSAKPSATVAWAIWCRRTAGRKPVRRSPVRNRHWPKRRWRWTARSSTSTAR
jgi:hypothetical protein